MSDRQSSRSTSEYHQGNERACARHLLPDIDDSLSTMSSVNSSSTFTSQSNSHHSLRIKLGKPSFVNMIHLDLWYDQVEGNHYNYSYCIESSLDGENWSKVIDWVIVQNYRLDRTKRSQNYARFRENIFYFLKNFPDFGLITHYSNYLCCGQQVLRFPKTVMLYLKIVGTHSNMNKYFSVSRLEVRYHPDSFEDHDIIDQIYRPKANCTAGSKVRQGVSSSCDALFQESVTYNWETGYTCHDNFEKTNHPIDPKNLIKF